MSFLSGGKPKDLLSKKANFYVEFLGWMETRGIRGDVYTNPIVDILLRRQSRVDRPPKLTIQISKKDIKISQDVEEKKKKNIQKIKFPTIPSRDVTYAVQSIRPDGKLDDIVSVIYLGYMPRTQRYVHAHVYRFDEPSTAMTFVELMNQLTDANAGRIRQVERDLAEKGEIEEPRRNHVGLNSSDGMSDPHPSIESPADSAASNSSFSDDSPQFGSDDIDPDLRSLSDVKPFDSVADELQYRLKIGDAPILLPPKDYDTVHRQHGNLSGAKERRCLNIDIIGGFPRERNGSGESGVDLNSPSSETGAPVNEYTSESLGKPVPPSSLNLNVNQVYPAPSPTSPLNHRRSQSTRDLDSPRHLREYNGYGSGSGSPALRRSDVYQRQHSGEFDPGVRRHEGIRKSASYNTYGEVNSPRRTPSYKGESGPNSPRVVAHGRQTSQSSMNSYKSDGSRGSRGSNDRDDYPIYPPVDDIPPADYDRTLGPVEMRRKVLKAQDYMSREDLGGSFPQEALRREFLAQSAGPRGPDIHDLRRSQNLVPEIQYRDVYDARHLAPNVLYR